MPNEITRRQMLTTVGTSAAAIVAAEVAAPDRVEAQQRPRNAAGPGRAEFWEPGPNKNLVRDLKPGPMRIRLTGL